MAFNFLRVLFILLCSVIGFQLGSDLRGYGTPWGVIGSGIGAGIAFLIVLVEKALGKISLRGLSAAVFGLLFSLIIAKFLTGVIDLVPELDPGTASVIKLALILILSYLGMIFSMRGRDEFSLIIPYIKFDRQDQKDTVMILDTSAIIDGRISDICQTKFLEGRFVVPRFVLKELQQVADSQDPLKRNRGRRGLEVLNKLRKDTHISVRINDEDFPELGAVDEKLIKLSRLLSAKIITNDFNLNKVAEFQGITILNINELSNALKPVILPGESLEVKIVKEGKEQNQGIGYLDDGTMVVVDNARRLLGQTLRVTVTSILQTAAGRMIFAKTDFH